MKFPKCGAEKREEANSRDHCGHRLEGVPAAAEAHLTLDAERKRVTALFSDLSGYTAMTSRLDPEDIKDITDRIFDGSGQLSANMMAS